MATPRTMTAPLLMEPQEPSAPPARKRRKTANKEAAPAKKVPAVAKKAPAAKSTTTRPKPRAKGKAANKENYRDDATTRAAIVRLKAGNAPGSAGGRAFKSRAIIDDDDEDDAPSADASGNASIVADSHAVAAAPAAAAMPVDAVA
ncbi:hypothetical protein B0H13DRAFT_2366425 [Mycena leptocephala]|nr:hypothetical protein B0H13DRAFT_2366425 [Mycena leptocephala]